MAVVQISRIQIRRGQKNTGTGLPQLASGELGWAIDTQELYIGNGAVSEGAPAVGNTNILTEHSDLFQFADSYTYESDSGVIQTGASSSSPIQRSLQDRLDDRVSVKAFGCLGDGSDCTTELQRAIDQLFINTATKGTTPSRVVLHMEPGTYKISDTLYLPPFATIRGAGSDKTVIEQTVAQPIFQTVNESSTPGSPANDSTSTTLNQARFIELKGMTLDHTDTYNIGLKLDSCADSVFEDIKITGSFASGFPISADSIGIQLNSLSTVVTCKNNKFKNVRISGFSYGSSSKWDITNNKWEDCLFETLGYGVVFGEGITLGLPGQNTGPLHNVIENSTFRDIERKGFWVNAGNYNLSLNNNYFNVGNEGGTESNASHSVIHFNTIYNHTDNDYFERTNALSFGSAYISSTPFVPSVEGSAFYKNHFSSKVGVGEITSPVRIFRLPADGTKAYTIEYWYNSSVYNALRSGVINLVYDASTGNLQLSDDYDYVGDISYERILKFNAQVIDQDGDASTDTLLITVQNSAIGDNGTVQFKVTTKS